MVSEEEPQRSVARTEHGFTVAPSPLNGVKFDLGAILAVGVVLLLIHRRITDDVILQFLLLLGYGVLGMTWVILRAHRVITALAAGRQDRDRHDGPQQE